MTSTRRMSGSERREQIRQAAQALFVENGYATTTSEVAEVADVSPALVVKYFGTKEELFRDSVAQPLTDVLETFVRRHRDRLPTIRADGPAEYLEQLSQFGEELVALVREYRPLVLALIRESVEFPDVARQLVGLAQSLVDELAAELGRFAADDDFVDFDPRAQTYLAIGSLVMGALTATAEDPKFVAHTHYRTQLFGLLSEDARDRARR